MQAFEIFKTGRHTAASGVTLDFSESQLKQAVAAYDPAIHEAPIVVGHPTDNGPAYGWIKALSFGEDGMITAEPEQVDAAFSEMVAAGRFKKRSASWYLPGSAAHPLKGTDRHNTLYLRHVGFLGAQPPAIKGLKDVSFSEDEGIIEFTDSSSSPWAWSSLASLFRGLREWLIEEKGLDTANNLLPQYRIDDLNDEAARKRNPPPQDTVTPAALPNFSEDQGMTPEQIAAMQAENERLKAEAQQAASFAERENTIAARERALRLKEIGAEVDALVAAGKVLPASRAGLVEFMATLPEDAVVEFGEGDQAKKLSPRAYMTEFLASLPKVVEFGELTSDTGKPAGAELEGQALADAAIAYKEKKAKDGIEVTTVEAVAAVRAGQTD